MSHHQRARGAAPRARDPGRLRAEPGRRPGLAWQPGKCFAFDDTYEHEVWNKSQTTRPVLLGDIWNPYLRQAEREALAELVGAIGDFNRRVAPAPVAGP